MAIGGVTPGSGNNLSSLNKLFQNTSALQRLQERLATGFSINKASDDPAGLVVSEMLRSRIAGMGAAVENTQRASNVLATAEGGLNEMSNLLVQARGLAIAAADTSRDPGEIAAYQSELNGILSSINRIANTTQFGGTDLLNGAQAFQIQNNAPAELAAVNLAQAAPGGGTQTVTVDVTASATSADAGALAAVQTGDVTVEITGNRGAATVTIAGGTDQAGVADAINAVAGDTGVVVQGNRVVSETAGAEATANIRNVSGTLSGITAGEFTGTDAAATVNGTPVSANGNTLDVVAGNIAGTITLAEGSGPGTYSFEVRGGGLALQLGPDTTPAGQARLGIPAMTASNLGLVGTNNTLDTVAEGGANSLAANPGRAADIIDAAIGQVSQLRGRMGSFQKNTLDTNMNSLRVGLENIMAAESNIRDTDYAATITEYLQTRTRQEANILVLAQAGNLNAQTVLQLLGS
ncbi:MAG: flagellin [Planctomycetota bacterium]